jgi:hypothetical protein
MKLLIAGMFVFCSVSLMAMEQTQQTVVQQLQQQQQEVENNNNANKKINYMTLSSILFGVGGSIAGAVSYAVCNAPVFALLTVPSGSCLFGCGVGYALYRCNPEQGYDTLKSDTNIPMTPMTQAMRREEE